MSSTSCTVCGSLELTPNEFDHSICCGQCGTVLQEWEINEPDGPENTSDPQEGPNKSNQLITRWKQVASFFKLREELVIKGMKVIDQHITRPSNVSIYYNEICVGLASSLAKKDNPFWSCQDFIKAFPSKLATAVTLRCFKTFEEVDGEPPLWADFPEKSIRVLLEPNYNEIISQLYGNKKVPSVFTLSTLVFKTKKLLELGTYQGINGGRKPRPLIAAAALHTALWMFSSTNKKKSATGKVAKTYKRRRKIEIISHIWQYSRLAETMLCTVKTIRETYYEYARMMIASAKKIPWISQDILTAKNVHLYLDDILELYSLNAGSEPVMSLSLEDFAPRCYRAARKKDTMVHDLIVLAKNHIEEEGVENDSEGNDEEKPALFYDVLYALKAGYTEEEIASWPIKEIQSVGESIKHKNASSSSSTRKSNVDLNRKDVGEDDMHEEELLGYVKRARRS